jgi:hypothetical protein
MKNKQRAGGSSGALLALVIVWFAGYMGLSMSTEQGVVVATACIAAGAEVWSHGIRGVLVHIWAGDEKVVVSTDEAKVVVQPVDDAHPTTEVRVTKDD